MAYRVEISKDAIREIDGFFAQFQEFSLQTAEKYQLALQRAN